MVLIGNTSAFELGFIYLSTYIFGTPQAAGIYLLTFLFLSLMMFRIEFSIGLIILFPLNVVLTAAGYINPLAGGIHILIVFMVLGFRFFRAKG